MITFLFVVSCLIFITTITWLSYKLGEQKGLNANKYACIGFLLAFVPPFAVGFVGYLLFKDGDTSL
ncbi:MAG: hypothetical protein WA981_03030 [Glaciecola sp.]